MRSLLTVLLELLSIGLVYEPAALKLLMLLMMRNLIFNYLQTEKDFIILL